LIERKISISLDYVYHLFLVLGGIANATGDEGIRSEAEDLLALIHQEEEKVDPCFLNNE